MFDRPLDRLLEWLLTGVLGALAVLELGLGRVGVLGALAVLELGLGLGMVSELRVREGVGHLLSDHFLDELDELGHDLSCSIAVQGLEEITNLHEVMSEAVHQERVLLQDLEQVHGLSLEILFLWLIGHLSLPGGIWGRRDCSRLLAYGPHLHLLLFTLTATAATATAVQDCSSLSLHSALSHRFVFYVLYVVYVVHLTLHTYVFQL